MEKIDITVIGAGVVGLAVAAELSGKYENLFVIEKYRSFGMETSSRNSEVIHSGVYYPPGSSKARFCVEGNAALYDICEKNKIPHKKTGKLIVSVSNNQTAVLERLLINGKENGVSGLKMLTGREARDLQPHIESAAALFVPSTGIIDSHRLMKYYAAEINANGADIIYNVELIGVSRQRQGYELKIRYPSGDEDVFFSGKVINSAGLESDEVAAMAGIDIEKNNYELHYCKGEYFRIASPYKCGLVNSPVYPVPDSNGCLGIHITPDMGGSIRLGPDSQYISREMNYETDYNKRIKFFESVKNFFPAVEPDDLISDTAGIRPRLRGKNGEERDFVVKEENEEGFPGFINLIGIESPGLTCAPAIAGYVKEIFFN